MAKMLNYLEGGWACDVMFSLFVLSWIVTRHYVFPKIIWAIYTQVPLDIPWAWNPSEGLFVCTSFWVGFLVLLLFLEILLIVWLWLILRIMWGVIMGNGADDERSDSELVFSFAPFLLPSLSPKNGLSLADDSPHHIMCARAIITSESEIEVREIKDSVLQGQATSVAEKTPLLINTPQLEALGQATDAKL